MTRIFVSHASADAVLVDGFIDLLITGAGVRSKEIFYSSRPGMGIEIGTMNFIEDIRNHLLPSSLFIPIVSPNFYASAYCLCELGAAWALEKDNGLKIFPLLVSLPNGESLSNILQVTQAGEINKRVSLAELCNQLNNLVDERIDLATWEFKVSSFVTTHCPIALPKLPQPKNVSIVEHERLQKNYELLLGKMQQMDEQIKQQNAYIEALEKVKDIPDDVKAKKLMEMSEAKKFDYYLDVFVKALNKLPSVVQDAFYCHSRREEYDPHDREDQYYADECLEEGYFTESSGGYDIKAYKLRESNPKLSKALAAQKELDVFLYSATPEFKKAFEEKYEFELDLELRPFWTLFVENGERLTEE